MAPRSGRPSRRALLISLSATLAVLALGAALSGQFTLSILGRRLLLPLLRLTLFIAAGLLMGQWIEFAGWTRSLAIVARPLFRLARLGDRCAATFTAAFFSGTAANAMLAGYYQDRTISKGQLFLTNLLNQVPAYFLHLPTTVFIVVPLTGWAGGLYFGLTFLALLMRTALIVLYGRITGAGESAQQEALDKGRSVSAERPRREPPAGFWAQVGTRLPRRLLGIIVYVVPIYAAVFVVNALGFFEAARNWLAIYVSTAFVPMESLSVVILSFAAEFASGFAAAGALQEAGMLTLSQTVLALLVGNVVAFPIRALRHQLPRYMGIFTPKLGLQLLLLGQGLRVGSLLLAGIGYYYVSA